MIFFSALALLPARDASWRLQLSDYATLAHWEKEEQLRPVVTSAALDLSIAAAAKYILNQQYPEGNFRYAYDLDLQLEDEKDNQVRQAGVLWSICNLNRERFTEETRRSAVLGLEFFLANQRGLPGTDLIVTTYQTKASEDEEQPDDRKTHKQREIVKTGTVALFCLALTDFMTGQDRYLPENIKKRYLTALENNLRFLQYQELPRGSWREEYELGGQRLEPQYASYSPYFDGESLLAYAMAAKFYRSHPELTPPIALEERIRLALPQLLAQYTVECFVPGGDTDYTKGFSQWGSMACAVIYELFPDDEEIRKLCLDGALTLSWWQIFGNRLDTRNGNTAYAIEGLVAAYTLARSAGLTKEAELIRSAIDGTLSRLMSWQFGGPFQDFSAYHKEWKGKAPARVFGGITASATKGYIRIDNVQHQLHAMLLARKYVYPDADDAEP